MYSISPYLAWTPKLGSVCSVLLRSYFHLMKMEVATKIHHFSFQNKCTQTLPTSRHYVRDYHLHHPSIHPFIHLSPSCWPFALSQSTSRFAYSSLPNSTTTFAMVVSQEIEGETHLKMNKMSSDDLCS